MLGRWLWALWSAHNTYAYVRLWRGSTGRPRALDRLEAIEAKAKRRGFATAAELEAEAADLRLALRPRCRGDPADEDHEAPGRERDRVARVFFDAEVFWTYVFAQLLELYRAATLSTRHTLNELLARHDRRSDGCPSRRHRARAAPRAARLAASPPGAASAVWASKRSLLSARAASPASSAAAPSFVDPRAALRVANVQIHMDSWVSARHLDLEARA
ncbi:hypothetical protein JL720_17246 [Aureococcus anophagefferens]|nr:hypothetical protein JL720_17246 [Aureococcus anophagefferens]